MSNERSTDIKELEFSASETSVFDIDAIEDRIQVHGVELLHYRAIPNPIGLISKDDARRPDNHDDSNVMNGFYYVRAGLFKALMTGNSKEVKATTGGITDPGIAQITSSCYYESDFIDEKDKEKVYLSVFDRLYINSEDVLVTGTAVVECSEIGVDRLPFPAHKIQVVVDSDGNQYGEGDFSLVNGDIKWTGSRRPPFNPVVGKGKICSVRYLYKPFWYIHRMVHEIRVVPQLDVEGSVFLRQAPQAAIVAREYFNRDEIKNMANS